ncbi:MAG TPA: cryptochrome/photolyase family protein [Planctomycetota bacterium]|jgi:deoxyribodipyrimidine photolyase-related protein|nr:cryptochrome/photolyase family protein [Planctomycetota bacterium]
MGVFTFELKRRAVPEGKREWIYIPYDQLTAEVGMLSRRDPADTGIVLVETPAKAARRPYHKRKLALLLTNLRHFALEQAERGVAVRHMVAQGDLVATLAKVAAELGALLVMQPAERELRTDLEPLRKSGHLKIAPHEGWLTTSDDFGAACGGSPPYRMDAFYRFVRRKTGYLMDAGRPVGGRFSFDGENRKPWRGQPAAPAPLSFPPDAITEEVVHLVESRFSTHFGSLEPASLPATLTDAEDLLQHFIKESLASFGPFEDAMSVRSRGLFHSRLSELINLQRLTPARIVRAVLDASVPVASKEGFLRQLLGWREFVHHVHDHTEGFRNLGDRPLSNGGFLSAKRTLPQAYWGAPSGLACLDEVVRSVREDAYSHHITRLMVLSNLAVLLDVHPEELSSWFWIAYADAYDWVVEPNVLGMGTFSMGEVMTTKPYVCGASYINRMGDACGACSFDPKTNCPMTNLYWAFLERKREFLQDNPRMAMPYRSLERRTPDQRAQDARVFEVVNRELTAGRSLTPDSLTNVTP